jgi:MFS family permease
VADSLAVVSVARVLDRVGKGVRGAPRDALVADLTPIEIRGASYGLRQSLDTVGAFAGPFLAMVLMRALDSNIRRVFWVAAIPAFVSVLILVLFVREPPGSMRQESTGLHFHWGELRQFSNAFWAVVVVGALFTLAHFTEAFLVLRANVLGLSAEYVPSVLVLMNVVYAASSYPAGHLSDRVDRRSVLAIGGFALVIADIVLAQAAGLVGLAVGIGFWGLHMGFSQGLLAALVADAAPAERRGTAFGLFSLISGIALLVASVVAGLLWDRVGPQATFYAGAIFAGVALSILLLQIRAARKNRFKAQPTA